MNAAKTEQRALMSARRGSGRVSRGRSPWCAALFGAFALSVWALGVSAEAADLSIRTINGASSVIVPPGGTVRSRVTLQAPLGTTYNAALFRMVFTVEGCSITNYAWRAPFVTGGSGDFSLDGAPLPLRVMDDTLAGPAYPLETADVEFGIFDFVQYAPAGEVLTMDFSLPPKAAEGTIFVVAALPDMFTSGFVEIPVSADTALIVQVGPPAPFADLDGDYAVGAGDLAILLGQWGTVGSGDLDGSGEVAAADLSLLLYHWSE